MYFDPIELQIHPSWFQGDSVENLKDQYQDAEEQLPPKQMCPEDRGVPVSTTAYVDASHAANKVLRSGHTGSIVFLNRELIILYSKRQKTV